MTFSVFMGCWNRHVAMYKFFRNITFSITMESHTSIYYTSTFEITPWFYVLQLSLIWLKLTLFLPGFVCINFRMIVIPAYKCEAFVLSVVTSLKLRCVTWSICFRTGAQWLFSSWSLPEEEKSVWTSWRMTPSMQFLLGKHDSQRFHFTHIHSPPGVRSLEIPQKAAPMCPGATAYHVVTCCPC